ncbi:MAG: hypothetical protein LC749_04540 [Actinobacteria bacterium]|nr:hypothetical protein [Actinomycetota bacterium]
MAVLIVAPPSCEKSVALYSCLLHRLRTALPCWLLAGQTWGYLDSEPLAADDVADIRMPFGAVPVVPADPPVVEPYGAPLATDAAERLERLGRGLATPARKPINRPASTGVMWNV